MFALFFDFPVRHYHATAWGRHVNEADIAWPPEPWRILRALISSYWRKGGCRNWSEEQLASLIDVLAETTPVFYLPEESIHSFTQHYMPISNKKSLIFDAFAYLPKEANIVVGWANVNLDSNDLAMAEELVAGISYLGRAESWTTCTVSCDWDLESANCLPVSEMNSNGDEDKNIVSVMVPRPSRDYALEREKLIQSLNEEIINEFEKNGKKTPSDTELEKRKKKQFGGTLPERLVDALTIETSEYKKYGWSRPPAACEILYHRPLLSSIPKRKNLPSYDLSNNKQNLTVARYVLAGRPLPRVEDTVKIGELMRSAALSKFGWHEDPHTGEKKPKAPSEISGRDSDGKPLQNSKHSHCFWIPEDSDGDGCIDHISVYAKSGLNHDVRRKLNQITRLWVGKKDTGDVEPELAEGALQEWRLALEGFGVPEDFEQMSRIFKCARVWDSLTPFLATGHLRKSGYEKEVHRQIRRRSIVSDSNVDNVLVEPLPNILVHGSSRSTLHFYRFRSRGGEQQIDTHGAFLRLTFPEPIRGPLAIGFGCHFGLGLFAPKI